MKQNKGLGSVPKGLAWLEQNPSAGEAQEQVVSQSVVPTQMTGLSDVASAKTEVPSVQKGLQQGWSRATFILKEDLIDKLKAVAYWERMTIKDVLQDALDEYFKNKDIQAIPQRRPKY